MSKAFQWSGKVVARLVIFLDLLTVGMGMGVPFFTILLGFPLGWYFARRAALSGDGMGMTLRRVFRWSALLVLFSAIVLLAIWGPTLPWLWGPADELANFGIPMILYEPKASFIGWIVLMVVISPLLQGLAALCAAYATFMRLWGNR